jgi:hypothetical protein
MIKPVSTGAKKAASAAAVTAVLLCLPVQAFAQMAPTAPRPAQTAIKPKAAAPATQAPTPQPQASSATQGLASGKTAADGDIVARVGNVNISADDIRSYIAALGVNEQAALAKDPALLSQAVRMLLANRLVLDEVRAKKWDQQPNVSAQLERVRDSAVVELYLQTASTPRANFPSDEDLQKIYDANREALLMPRQFQLAQIFIPVPKDADKATEDKAKGGLAEIQRKLKTPGADFATIAADSGDKSGGNLGWVAENQVRPEIRTQVMGLAKNATSEPIRLDDGWHIIKLIDTKAAYTRTLPEVREQLVQKIRAERAAMLRRAYLTELLKQHPPVLNELALSNLLDKSSK